MSRSSLLLGVAFAVWGCTRSEEAPAQALGEKPSFSEKQTGAVAPARASPTPAPLPEVPPGRGIINPPAGIARAIVREEPSLSAREVGRLHGGTDVAVMARTPDRMWYRIATSDLPGQLGWIHGDVIRAGRVDTIVSPAPRREPEVPAVCRGCDLSGCLAEADKQADPAFARRLRRLACEPKPNCPYLGKAVDNICAGELRR